MPEGHVSYGSGAGKADARGKSASQRYSRTSSTAQAGGSSPTFSGLRAGFDGALAQLASHTPIPAATSARTNKRGAPKGPERPLSRPASPVTTARYSIGSPCFDVLFVA